METAEPIALDAAWAAVALCACCIIVVFAVLARVRFKSRPATIAWCIPFVAVTAFFAVWCARGLCQIQPALFCLYQALCALLGIAVLQRDRVARAFGDAIASGGARASGGNALARLLPWLRDLLLLVVATVLSFLALEVADNPEWMSIGIPMMLRGMLVIFLAMLCLYFLGQRCGVLCIAVPVVCAIFGLVQVFLDLFKNTALLPSDVVAWKTAAAVAGGYTYTLPTLAVTSIVCAAGAVAVLAFIAPLGADGTRGQAMPLQAAARQDGIGATTSLRQDLAEAPSSRRQDGTGAPSGSRKGGKGARIAVNLACAAVCALGAFASVAAIDYQDAYGVKLDYWDLRNSYHRHGFLVSFVAATQDLRVDKPEGYSDQTAQKLQQQLAQRYDEELASTHEQDRSRFERQRPSVIAIMNESYSDLSLFQELHDGYAGTYVTQQLKDLVAGGWLDMSVHGGGTCNSEYEFLAFSSMAYLSSGMYPYQQFSFANATTLPSVFRELGYDTWAMHPSYPGNWSRELVYATMGIDKSLFVYDFEGAEEVHGLVSDRATYEKALDILQDADEPQFILDITMQNHGGYDTGSIPADQMTDYHPDFLDDTATFELNEFLSCIKASDEAVEYLIAELAKLDEPVAVVFFGDHQPALSRDLNDALFTGESELVHKARITKTPYFIWTNYGVGGKPWRAGADDAANEGGLSDESSALFLGAQLLEAIGAPLSDYQKALLVLHQEVTAVNTNGFRDAQGAWHDASEGGAVDHPYHELQVLHYYNVVRNL